MAPGSVRRREGPGSPAGSASGSAARPGDVGACCSGKVLHRIIRSNHWVAQPSWENRAGCPADAFKDSSVSQTQCWPSRIITVTGLNADRLRKEYLGSDYARDF